MVKKYDLEKRLVSFSASIIIGIDALRDSFAAEHLKKQLIRSATSSALNYGEAQAAESKRDFIHKMKICLKELRESQINLQILEEANLIKEDRMKYIAQECKELVAIFTSSIKTITK